MFGPLVEVPGLIGLVNVAFWLQKALDVGRDGTGGQNEPLIARTLYPALAAAASKASV